ncbi:MAG: metal-dependent transcriptional regulator [Candidatus Anammoxibacter sp.]
MTELKVEEALECLWTAEEQSVTMKIDSINEKFGIKSAHKLLHKMADDGFVQFDDDSKVDLTDTGREEAKLVIRRHRLAERLLHDVLDITSDEYESGACRFEHYVGDDVVASICILLGHPSSCPHGRAIPKGECCSKHPKDIKSLVLPLSKMNSGDTGKVVYISTEFHDRLDRISGIGILPGTKIKVHQKMPTLVIQIGETQVALDNNIASNIYMRRKHF